MERGGLPDGTGDPSETSVTSVTEPPAETTAPAETSVTDDTEETENEYDIAPMAYDDVYIPKLEGDTYVIDLSKITIDLDTVEGNTTLASAEGVKIFVESKSQILFIKAEISAGCKVQLTGSLQVKNESSGFAIINLNIENEGEITDFTCEKSSISLTVNNYGTISGGTYNCSVDNEKGGIITGGNFTYGTLDNRGTIKGGTFSNTVLFNWFGGVIEGGTFDVSDLDTETLITGGDFRNTSFSWDESCSVTGGIFNESAGVPEGSSYISWNESEKTYTVHGEVTLDETFKLSAGETLVIPDGASITNIDELSGQLQGTVINTNYPHYTYGEEIKLTAQKLKPPPPEKESLRPGIAVISLPMLISDSYDVTLTVNETPVKNMTVQKQENDSTYYISVEISQENGFKIGENTIKANFTGEYFYLASLNGSGNDTIKVIVDQLPAEIKWQDETIFIYDGTEKTVSAEVTNKVDGDTFNIVYEGNTGTGAGDYTAKITSLGNENYMLVGTPEFKWKISSGIIELNPGETVKTNDGSITNKDGTVEMKDKDGNTTTTVTLPGASGSVEVDKDGNVTVPAGSKVQTGDTTITLPNGGTIDKDGTVKADKIQIGDNTISGEGLTVDKEGNIKVPDSGTISVTENNVTVEYTGDTTFTDEGSTIYKSSDGYILLNIEDKDSETELGKFIGNKVGNNYEIKVPYDITLLYNGKTKVQPSGKVTVTIGVPSDIDGSEAKVFHQNGSDFELVNAVYSSTEKTLSFETNHFSIYAIAVPNSTGGSGGSSSGGSSENSSGSSYRPSYSVVTETSEKKETVLVKIENAVTGKKTLVNADKIDNVVTVDLGSKCNGYYANIYNENGDLIAVGVIKDNKVSFDFIGSGDISLIVDKVSYAEDISLGAGEFSSESEIGKDPAEKTAVCVSALFLAAAALLIAKRKHSK